MKRILVVGGGGYIGSHMVLKLKAKGFEPLVLDNLSTGYAHAGLGAKFIIGDLADSELLDQIFSSQKIAAVMHFASSIEVAESLRDPGKYYQNNVVNTLCLLQAMSRAKVKALIFSSSAAVYGEPQYLPIDEKHPLSPLNPYGRTKVMVEQILDDFCRSEGLASVSLRYFNAAGADPLGRLGELHSPETHLIPLALQATLPGGSALSVYGRDYPTPDGTCIRDYVHVDDLCEAHFLALSALLEGSGAKIYNLGIGKGYSVQEVIEGVKELTQREVIIHEAARRPGDPAVLVADSRAAQKHLGWQPRYLDLETIIKHAWHFEQMKIKAERVI